MTKVAAPPAPPSSLRGLRLGLDIALGVLLLLAGLVAIASWWVRSGQNGFDGTARLAGLNAPATIVRDARGIPHITAQNVHDLFLAEGYAMAQDRLWQMDVMRRAGEGCLAEVFGPVALSADEQTRTLGLDQAVSAEAGRLRPDERALLEAFAAGVNDYMNGRNWTLPVEFWLLRYRPQTWEPQDTLAVAAYMYQVLSSNYKDKLRRETFTAALGPQLAAQLFPDRSPWDVVPGEAPPPPDRLLPPYSPGSRGRGSRGVAALPEFAAPQAEMQGSRERGGSNNWVLARTRSFDGQPILANDPHLEFQIPGQWWVAQLTAGELDAVGSTLVGVPGIIIGHNQYIAWGVTNTDADVQDLYREKLDGKGNVLTPGGWQPLRYWHEKIPVRGAAAVPLDIAVTRHGPIVAHDVGGPLALDWSLYAPGALQAVGTLLKVDEARNWTEFEAALSGFAGPTQNFVYADTAGHIAYQAAGWVPLRAANWGAMDVSDGTVPVPGDTAAYDWHGWIPFDKLPHVLDPPTGMLVTANSRVTRDGYPHTISADWDAPNRTRRIYQRLGVLQHWNASAMGRVQQDVVSEQDADFAAAVVAAGQAEAARGAGLNANTERAVALLRGFRGAMGYSSDAPTLAYETRQEFLRRVIAAKTSDALAREYKWDESPVFEQWLLTAHPAAWLPPEYRAASSGGWNALLIASLQSVATQLTLEPAALRWGRFETLDIKHPVFSHIPVLRGLADLGPAEINGSPLTVKQARNTELGNTSDLGPSMRFVADLGNWDRSTLTLVAGESGVLFSPHYRDQFPAYLRGEALPLWFTPSTVAQHRVHQLRLMP